MILLDRSILLLIGFASGIYVIIHFMPVLCPCPSWLLKGKHMKTAPCIPHMHTCTLVGHESSIQGIIYPRNSDKGVQEVLRGH